MKNKNPDKPWITSFSSKIAPIISKEKDRFLSEASINKLKGFVPDIDLNKNSDLLPIAFNAYVANRVNANDDLVATDAAIKMRDHFVNKPINIEHNRNHIVGCILKSGFSKFGSDEPFDDEDSLIEYLLSEGEYYPFNSTLGGVLWKVAGEELTSFIEDASDPSSNFYNQVSASWEVSFSEFYILMLPEGSRNYSDGEVITDDEQVEIMSEYLRGFGGSGVYNGKRIYRLIVGDITPLGIGLTEDPAADVKGVLTKKRGLEGMVEDNNYQEDDSKCDYKKTKTAKNQQKTVKDNKDKFIINKIMELKDITDEKLKAGEISASVISDFIEDGLKDASQKFADEKSALEKNVSEAKALAEQLKQENEKVQNDLAKAAKELESLRAELEAKKAEESFNSRMAVVAEKFNLTESQEKAIAKEIKEIDSDESFASYIDRISLFVSPKEDKKEDKEEAKASAVVSDAIDNGETKKEAVASQSTDAPSLAERFKKGFSVKFDKGQFTV